MGKGKMTLLDVSAMTKELQKVVGLRVANIYHLNARTYLLKLSASSQRLLLLLESGVRLHCTQYHREHEALPNQFAAKLRKHIRMLRLEEVRQLGADRVVELVFGRGERQCRLLLEMYAQGNIVLTDAEYRIIMTLRVHHYGDAPAAALAAGEAADSEQRDDAGHDEPQQEQQAATQEDAEDAVDDDNFEEIERRGLAKERQQDTDAAAAVSRPAGGSDRVAVRAIYPFHRAQKAQEAVSRQSVMQIIRLQSQKQREEEEKLQREEEEKERQQQQQQQQQEQQQQQAEQAEPEDSLEDSVAGQQRPGKKRRKVAAASAFPMRPKRRVVRLPPLKAVLASHLHYGPELIEHCLLLAGLDGNAVMDVSGWGEVEADRVVEAFKEAPLIMERIEKQPLKGYIVVREEGGKAAEQQSKKAAKSKKKKGKRTAEQQLEQEQQQQQESAASTAATAPAASPTTAPSSSTSASSSLPSPSAPSSSVSAQPVVDSSAPAAAGQDGAVSVYSEYLPILLAQHSPDLAGGAYSASSCRVVEFESLDAAMDEFYSKQEAQREELRLLRERAAALQKIERVRQSHEKQLSALQSSQEDNRRRAELLELNTATVDAAIASVNAELAKGTDWRELQRIVKQEKANANPVAMIVAALRLDQNSITVALSPGLAHLHPSFSYATASAEQRPVKVDVDLSLSAFNNASLYYSSKKTQALKAERTSEASEKALRAAEKRTAAALKAVDVRARIQKLRRVLWFEKFHWFISSENLLVIGGKDAQQNELIVRRHLQRGDLYVHADVHGASSVVIKNPAPSSPVPPTTIQQAATMCICRSSAWKGKVQVDAYWVQAEQVSRSPPTGQFLAAGSFMIRGKKNFVTRMPLVMGLAVLFRLEDDCVDRHRGDRRVRGVEGEGDEAEEPVAATQGKTETTRTSGKSDSQDDDKEEPEAAETQPQDGQDDDFDVTSAMVQGLRLQGQSRKLALSDLSSEGEGEADGDTAEAEEKKEARKRLSAAEKRRLKKAQEKSGRQTEDATSAKPVDGVAAASLLNGDAEATSGAAGDDATEGESSSRRKNAKTKKAGSAAEEDAASKGVKAGKTAPAAAPLSRGKRNKLKKIAKRYGQQDEEDLTIAAAVLGLQNVEKKKQEIVRKEKQERDRRKQSSTCSGSQEQQEEDDEEDAKEGGEKENEDSPQRPQRQKAAGRQGGAAGEGGVSSAASATADADAADRVCYLCKQRGHLFKHCPLRSEQSQQQAAPEAAVTFSAARRQAETAEQEELEALRGEEHISSSSSSSSSSSNAAAASPLSVVDSLTGRPLEEDSLQYALCVCAPYSALSDYRFRVKLLPGSQKKGKLCQAALGLWMRQPGARELERELLRGLREDEMQAVLLSNVKLAVGLAGEAAKGQRRVKPEDSIKSIE